MATITLSKLVHKNESHIAINFDYCATLKNYIKAFGNVRWSQTHSVFYTHYSAVNLHQLFLYLRQGNHFVDYKALTSEVSQSNNTNFSKKNISLGKLTETHYHAITNFEKFLLQKRYSQNTVKTYMGVLSIFFRYHSLKAIEAISKDDIIIFNQNYILKNGYSRTFQNQVISAIKLFYTYHSNVQLDVNAIERPIKDKRLPEILSQEEVKELLIKIKNVKHKTILSLVYACGLRIGEALSIKMDAIDSTRGFIHIKHAKGAKDRYVPLSEKTLILLRHYYFLFKPKVYLFEGNEGRVYSQASCRKILSTAVAATSIKKRVTLHTLRHSYATHLLENGTDLRYIQDILGHNSPKTTMIYTHMSQSSLRNIKNPFDDMDI